jgi:hypothetical protein
MYGYPLYNNSVGSLPTMSVSRNANFFGQSTKPWRQSGALRQSRWVLSNRRRKCTANCIQLFSLCEGNLHACLFLIPIESSWQRHGQHCMSDCFALCHEMHCLALITIVLLKRELIGLLSCILDCLSCITEAHCLVSYMCS